MHMSFLIWTIVIHFIMGLTARLWSVYNWAKLQPPGFLTGTRKFHIFSILMSAWRVSISLYLFFKPKLYLFEQCMMG